MEQLVDHGAAERFNGGRLLGRERGETGVHAAHLGKAQFFSTLLERDDDGSDVHGALALLEALDLGGDDGFCVGGFAGALGEVGGSDGLEIVDVVEEDAFEAIDGGFNIARHGNIDEKHGAVAALLKEAMRVFAGEDGMGCAGGGDDDVGLAGGLVQRLPRDDLWADGDGEVSGHGVGAFAGAVSEQDGAGAMSDEMARGEFAHLAGADEEDGFAVERAEDFAREIDGDRGDGDGGAADLRLRADFFCGGEGGLQQRLKLGGDGADFAPGVVSILDLTENLRLADDHGIEAGGDAEEMTNGGDIMKLVEVRREFDGIDGEVLGEEVIDARIGRVGGGENLDAVAGGEDHGFTDAGNGGKLARRFCEAIAGNGHALAQFDGGRFVVDAEQDEIHGTGNL